jgi:predicted permease
MAMLRGRRLEAEYDDELNFHLEMKAHQYEAAGMTPEQARREAALHFGNSTIVREGCREANGISWISSLWQDIGFGVRSLRHNPAFTVSALLALVLGIGANTALFTVIRGVLLRPIPLPDSGRIVLIDSGAFRNGVFERSESWTPKASYDIAHHSRSFNSVTAFTGGVMALTGAGEPRNVSMANVTEPFFRVLGLKPRLGRTFLNTDRLVADQDDGVILGERFWRVAWHADPAIIGRQITLDGRKRTIIGVLPTFAPLINGDPDVFTPLTLNPAEDNNAFLYMAGRLKPSVTTQQAQAELSSMLSELDRTLPLDRRGGRGVLIPLQEAVAEKIRTLLLILLGAVALILLIACANVANLLLARAGARHQEIAIRASLGASRARLIRQLLTESVLLSLAGGLLGLLLCFWAVPVLLALAPEGQIPRTGDIRVDGLVFTFALIISLLTGLVFGIAPALYATQPTPSRFQTRRAQNLRGVLVAAEVALTLALLSGAGLLLKSLYRMMVTPTGFDRQNILTTTVALPDRVYTTTQPMRRFYCSVLERIQLLPGVDSAGMVSMLPLGVQWFRGDFTIEGQPDNHWMVGKPDASPDYFRAMGIPLLRGRPFDARDTSSAPNVAIISESIARQFFRNSDPIGHRLTLDDPKEGRWLTIVGVVGDVKQERLAATTEPQVYVPFEQEPRTVFMSLGSLIVRTRLDPASMAESIRKAINAVDPDLPVFENATVQQLVDRSAASSRFETRLLAGFALLALLLAAIGIYGVVAYGVSQRTQEIGIRRALGADKSHILGIVIGRNLPYLVAGLALGIAGTLASTRVLSSLLYDVQPHDVLVLLAAPVLLGLIALLASYLPARAAMEVEPTVALRYE